LGILPAEVQMNGASVEDVVLRPVPKRARDPLATGAIFRALPASLRSPLPRLLSPQSRVLSSAAEQQGHFAQPQQHSVGGGSTGRFGHLASRFDELYSKSPTPKVLLSRQQAQQQASAEIPHSSALSHARRRVAGAQLGGDAQFASPSPRAPASKKRAVATFQAADEHSEDKAVSSTRKSARSTKADTAASTKTRSRDYANGHGPVSPSAMSEDMDIDDLDVTPRRTTPPLRHATPPLPLETSATHTEQSERRASRRGAPSTNSAKSLSSAGGAQLGGGGGTTPLKAAPRASSENGDAISSGTLGAEANGSAKGPRQTIKGKNVTKASGGRGGNAKTATQSSGGVGSTGVSRVGKTNAEAAPVQAAGGAGDGRRQKRQASLTTTALHQNVENLEPSASSVRGGGGGGGKQRAGGGKGKKERDEVGEREPSHREKSKVLSNWSIRLKRSSRGELGIIVEGFLAEVRGLV